MERGFHNSAPLLAIIIRDFALHVFEPDKGLRVAEQTPAITLFPVFARISKDPSDAEQERLHWNSPANQESRLMLVPTGEQTVDFSQSIVELVSTLTPGSIALLEREVGRVVFVGIGSVCPSSAVDLLFCVLFHPLCGGVLAGFGVPVASVDESLLGWERHVWVIAIMLFGLGGLLEVALAMD